MKKLRNILLSLMTAILVMAPSIKVDAKQPINFYLFYGDGCPHCETALEYIDSLSKEERAKFNLVKYEVWYNEENSNLMQDVAKALKDDTSNLGVPYIVIGEETIIGFAENYSEAEVKAAIDKAYNAEDRFDVSDEVDFSKGTISEDSDKATGVRNTKTNIKTVIALVIIVIGIVGLLVFAKVKTK